MNPSSPEPDPGDESTSSTLSDSIKRMKLINNQHFMEAHPNAQQLETSNKCALSSDMIDMS